MPPIFCGRFSTPEAILSISLGDILFSLGSISVHLTESYIHGAFQPSTTSTTPADLSSSLPLIDGYPTKNSTAEVEHLIQMPLSSGATARTILCFAYMGLHVVNLLLALLLWQAVAKESILKTVGYLVISPLVALLGLTFVLYNFLELGLEPYYYAIGMYPLYFSYKLGILLFVIPRFLAEIRAAPSERKRRKRKDEYYQLGDSQMSLRTIREEAEEEEEDIPLLPRKYDIDPTALKLDHQTSLGFDEVHSTIRGVLQLQGGEFTSVAVKTLKVTTPSVPWSARLKRQGALLALVGEHEGILSFLGLAVKTEPKEKVFLVTEYYPKGTLESFLRDAKETFQGKTFHNLLQDDAICVPSTRKANELPNFDTLDTLEWACQIAAGMEHLHRKRIIHGCLQSKSVALFRSDHVKILDFTFATTLKSTDNLVKREDLPSRFPWRWAALELLTSTSSDEIRFTTRTDVWSYAITLWEIFSLGNVPYGVWESDIVRNLLNGTRLEKPEFASQQLFDIMNACWRRDPVERPNFSLLKLFFQQLLASSKKSCAGGLGGLNSSS